MADAPDTLTLERNRDREGMIPGGVWWRRGILSLVALFCVLGLANLFGQRPSTVLARAPAADLKVYAPTRLRGGLLFSARFHIYAHRDLKKAFLILDPGWLEGMAVNTIEPSPVGQASDNGRLSFELGHIPAGKSYILFIQIQVNPTNVAWRRRADVDLVDGSTRIVHVHRTVTIFP